MSLHRFLLISCSLLLINVPGAEIILEDDQVINGDIVLKDEDKIVIDVTCSTDSARLIRRRHSTSLSDYRRYRYDALSAANSLKKIDMTAARLGLERVYARGKVDLFIK